MLCRTTSHFWKHQKLLNPKAEVILKKKRLKWLAKGKAEKNPIPNKNEKIAKEWLLIKTKNIIQAVNLKIL